MMRRCGACVLVVIWFLSGGVVEAGEFDGRAIDPFIERSLDRLDGGCALILVRDGQVIYRKGYGNFPVDRVVPIASASKWISGCVIMALVDEGKLSLDDQAAKFLPELKDSKTGTMTIRQMFSHTHGLPDEPHHHRNTKLTMEESVNLILKMPPKFDPGKALYYSGTGMQLAGFIATKVTGKTWETIFREKIGDPCEMKSTDYFGFGETRNPNVAGSVRTSVDDYGNVVMMLLNRGTFKGRRVLSEKAVEAMFTNQTGNVPIQRHPWLPYGEFDKDMGKTRYGIGCWLEEMDAKTGKASRASSGGAFGCQPFVDYKRNLAGVYLPYTRRMKQAPNGLAYNEASVVYLDLRKVIAAVLDGKPTEGLMPRAVGQGTAKPAGPKPEPPGGEPAGGEAKQRAQHMMERLDRNKDGFLSRDEMPERLARAFDRIDTNRDGKISLDELLTALQMYESQGGTGGNGKVAGKEVMSVV